MAEENPSISPSAQPAIGTEEGRDQLLEQLFALPYEQQVEVFRAAAPRILARTHGATEARRFLDSLDTAMPTEALSPPEGATAKVPADRVAGDILRQSIGDQQYIMNIAGPRIVSGVIGPERKALLDDVARQIEEAEAGKTDSFEGPVS